MERFHLKNGLLVLFKKNDSNTVAVELMVKVGSNHEDNKFRGISHYLEHMLFEGTKKRPTSKDIASDIEKFGAEFNAYTTGDRTAYYVKIINKHFEIALDILSDMVLNSVFNAQKMQKEKKVILKEINMVIDDPRQHQWTIFQNALFEKHPAKYPTYGSIETVKSITRAQLMSYYQKHYTAGNMILSISGNVHDIRPLAQHYFGAICKGKHLVRKKVLEPRQETPKFFIEKRKTKNSYTVMGFKTAPRLDADSYVLDVIYAILGKGQSGWIFEEIRNKRGLAYQVGVVVEHEIDYGYFAVYCNLDKSKIAQAKGIIAEQFKNLQAISKNDLVDAKTYLEGNQAVQMEDNFHKADTLAFWETMGNVKLYLDYSKKIKSVTVGDIKKVAKKYFSDVYTFVSIEQE